MDAAHKDLTAGASPAKQKSRTAEFSNLTWTEKYRPKVPNDIIGNQSLVSQSLMFSFAIVTLHIIFSGFVCANQILMSLRLSFVAFYNCRSNNFMIGWHIGTKTS